jgi:GMP synthase-like glutamine amidotransferase
MKITIIQVGQTPDSMLDKYERFEPQYQNLLLQSGQSFEFETAAIIDGEKFPDIANLQGIIITGSAFGVYERPLWIDDLREFIIASYSANIAMVGICFGHQIMADALGGKVEKSNKGWGIGRHVYRMKQKPIFMNGVGDEIAIAASHQDQVVVAPDEAEVFMSSDFTPNAGLIYKNGKAISMQPHPEFDKAYSKALVDRLDDGRLRDSQAQDAHASLEKRLDRMEVGVGLARFFKGLE